ncbi:hypothetical protein BH23ACT9_BH23ACT9_35250 [soil metagenome]
MIRTQVSFTEEQKRRLDALAAATGASLSALIRRAVDERYPPRRDVGADLAAIEGSAGAWADRDIDGAAYVDGLRSGVRPEVP